MIELAPSYSPIRLMVDPLHRIRGQPASAGINRLPLNIFIGAGGSSIEPHSGQERIRGQPASAGLNPLPLNLFIDAGGSSIEPHSGQERIRGHPASAGINRLPLNLFTDAGGNSHRTAQRPRAHPRSTCFSRFESLAPEFIQGCWQVRVKLSVSPRPRVTVSGLHRLSASPRPRVLASRLPTDCCQLPTSYRSPFVSNQSSQIAL
jgi:hypothetical protein